VSGALYLRAARRGRRHPGGDLPAEVLDRAGVQVDVGHLAAYARVCGYRLDDPLPATYPHLLGFPLQLRLLTGPGFPLAAMGLVHVRNVVSQTRALRVGEELGVRVHAERLRPHPKGAQVDLVTEVGAGGEQVWSGRSTYLARGAEAAGSPGDDGRPEVPDLPGAAYARWRVPADAGRRYAAVSGDVNPIHLNAIAARAFGFPRAIAHGMWAAARALAALEGRHGDAVSYDVAFGRPLLLPSSAELRTRRVPDGWDLALTGSGGDRRHLTGTVRSSLDPSD
jgi:acyl dehydratase